MTLEALQSIVLKLANQVPTRFWVHWNYPNHPIEMALFVDCHVDFSKPLWDELQQRGFHYESSLRVWIANRTNEDGTPYESKL